MNIYEYLLPNGSWCHFIGGIMQITELGQIIIYNEDVLIYTEIKAIFPSSATLIITKNAHNEKI
jgi:hypothetical protein